MHALRDIIYALVAVLTSPFWGYRLLATGKWRTDWHGRLGRCTPPAQHDGTRGDAPVLLVHAVSVGEVKAVRPLVDHLRSTQPDLRIVISVTTDTGIAQARSLYEPHCTVVRYPLDFSWSVRRFLDAVQPTAVALAELEVWPNFVSLCHRRGIPVCVINGRLSERGFRRYRWIAALLRGTFGKLAFAAVQTQAYAERFIAMGVASDRVHVCDTMKWDAAQITLPQDVPGAVELAQAMGIDRSRPIVVAGSTAPGEDQLLIDTCPEQVQLILVPRKPEWFEGTARLAPRIVRRSAHPDGTARQVDGQRLFLLDTMGELRKAYALADVVVVGRSFLGLYGSDVMEPAALGRPTIIGTYHSDFAETVAALQKADGLIVTSDPGQAVRDLLENPERAAQVGQNGQEAIRSRQGAARRHADLLTMVLPLQSPQHDRDGRQNATCP